MASATSSGSQRYRPRSKHHVAIERVLSDAVGGDMGAAAPAAASRFGEEAVNAKAGQASSAALDDQDETGSPRSTWLLLRSGTAQSRGRLGTPSSGATASASLGTQAPSTRENPTAASAACDAGPLDTAASAQAASSLSIGAVGLTAAAPARARTQRGLKRNVSFADEVTAQRMADEALGGREEDAGDGGHGGGPAAAEEARAAASDDPVEASGGQDVATRTGPSPANTAQVGRPTHVSTGNDGDRRRALRARMRSHAIRITAEDWVR